MLPSKPATRPRVFLPRLPVQPLYEILTVLNRHKRGGDALCAELRALAELAKRSRAVWKHDQEAICRVLADLAKFNFTFKVARKEIYFMPRQLSADHLKAKEMVRAGLLAGRSQQLEKPNVQAFLRSMHEPRIVNGKPRSIDDLIDNGPDLARSLRAHRGGDLRQVCDPYLEYADVTKVCELTGLNLMDIWRYFRHTWSSEYRPTPGRTLCFMIRNRARPFHPVMGIIGLANAVFQLRDRDDWVGWTPVSVLKRIKADASYWKVYKKAALRTLSENRNSVRDDDLLKEIGRTKDPLKMVERLDRIRHEAAEERNRLLEEQYERDGVAKPAAARAIPRLENGDNDWLAASDLPLFRRKRAELLADVIFAEHHLSAFDGSAQDLLDQVTLEPDADGELTPNWKNKDLGRAFHIAVREIKKNGVATRIMDVNVCGATPVYREILGGKLAALALFSKEIQDRYVDNYKRQPSEIASSMKGEDVFKLTKLSLLTTTSLYGVGSSQYNRLRMEHGGSVLQWKEIGHTEGYGTIHISQETTDVLRELAVRKAGRRNVNNKFGEGTSPLLRQIREGLSAIHFSPNDVLQHNQPRIVYALELHAGARDDLALNQSKKIDNPSMEAVAGNWIARWLSKRIENDEILDRVSLVNAETVKQDLRVADSPMQLVIQTR